jgi:hypothetical protein
MASSNLNYPELFTALGKFIADKKLADVCVMEFEDGIIIAGSIVYDSRGGTQRSQETFVLSAADLDKLTGKRGLLKR